MTTMLCALRPALCALALRRQRQPNDEPRPRSRLALRPDLPAERFNQTAADRKAQPCPAVVAGAGRADLAELVEDALELIGGDSRAFVPHDALRPPVADT